MSHTAQSHSTPSADEAVGALASDATHGVKGEKQDIRESNAGRVADKQLYRWKDDGGALPPEGY